MQKDTVLTRIAQLPKMPAEELKALWGELFEKEMPCFNRVFLEARLAYRLQELAFGGLSEEAISRLKRLNQAEIKEHIGKRATKPATGTILVREFKGVEHRVRVMADGFEHLGIKYRSLTAVALKITGSSWNGLEFFGLKTKKAKGA